MDYILFVRVANATLNLNPEVQATAWSPRFAPVSPSSPVSCTASKKRSFALSSRLLPPQTSSQPPAHPSRGAISHTHFHSPSPVCPASPLRVRPQEADASKYVTPAELAEMMRPESGLKWRGGALIPHPWIPLSSRIISLISLTTLRSDPIKFNPTAGLPGSESSLRSSSRRGGCVPPPTRGVATIGFSLLALHFIPARPLDPPFPLCPSPAPLPPHPPRIRSVSAQHLPCVRVVSGGPGCCPRRGEAPGRQNHPPRAHAVADIQRPSRGSIWAARGALPQGPSAGLVRPSGASGAQGTSVGARTFAITERRRRWRIKGGCCDSVQTGGGRDQGGAALWWPAGDRLQLHRYRGGGPHRLRICCERLMGRGGARP